MNKELDLNSFSELNSEELCSIDGGIFPIIIAGVAITKGAAIAGGLFLAGVGIGVAWACSE